VERRAVLAARRDGPEGETDQLVQQANEIVSRFQSITRKALTTGEVPRDQPKRLSAAARSELENAYAEHGIDGEEFRQALARLQAAEAAMDSPAFGPQTAPASPPSAVLQ
jgi:hypothetical protein